MTSMNIRIATPGDAEAVQAIYAPYVTDTAISFEYEAPSVEEMRRRIALISEVYPFIVAEVDSKVVAYAYAGVFHAREAYLHSVETSIYVDKAYVGMGIGKILYTALEEMLLKQNVYNLHACIAVPDEPDEHLNDDSVKFHKAMGYQVAGRHSKCGYKFN